MFRPLKATLSGRETTVLLKLVVDGTTDRVVGCHIVGEGAAEMIQIATIAVKMGATKADFDATMALHPTAAEELVTLRQEAPATPAKPRNSRAFFGLSLAGGAVYKSARLRLVSRHPEARAKRPSRASFEGRWRPLRMRALEMW